MTIEFLYLIGILSIVLGIPISLNAIYFHYRYQKKLDKKIMGDNYFDMGFPFNLLRLFEYGLYCLSKKLAIKKEVNSTFINLDTKQKLHLIFHSLGLLLSAVLFIIAYIGLWHLGEL